MPPMAISPQWWRIDVYPRLRHHIHIQFFMNGDSDLSKEPGGVEQSFLPTGEPEVRWLNSGDKPSSQYHQHRTDSCRDNPAGERVPDT